MITSNKGTGKTFGSQGYRRRPKRPQNNDDNGKLMYAFLLSLFLLQASLTYVASDITSNLINPNTPGNPNER